MGLLPRSRASALALHSRAETERRIRDQRESLRRARAETRRSLREAKQVLSEALAVALDGGSCVKPHLAIGIAAQGLLEDQGFAVFPVLKGLDYQDLPASDHPASLLRAYRCSIQRYRNVVSTSLRQVFPDADPGVIETVISKLLPPVYLSNEDSWRFALRRLENLEEKVELRLHVRLSQLANGRADMPEDERRLLVNVDVAGAEFQVLESAIHGAAESCREVLRDYRRQFPLGWTIDSPPIVGESEVFIAWGATSAVHETEPVTANLPSGAYLSWVAGRDGQVFFGRLNDAIARAATRGEDQWLVQESLIDEFVVARRGLRELRQTLSMLGYSAVGIGRRLKVRW